MGIFCKDCHKELLENERPCSACGCLGRAYEMKCEIGQYRAIFGTMKWKHKRPGFKRPIAEGLNRPNKASHDYGVVSEIQVVDRIKKWWKHVVVEVQTGKIIHDEGGSLLDKNKK